MVIKMATYHVQTTQRFSQILKADLVCFQLGNTAQKTLHAHNFF